MKTVLFVLVFFFLVLSQALKGQTFSTRDTLVFGVFPYLNVEESYQYWKMVLSVVSKEIQKNFEIKVYHGYGEFLNAFLSESFDLAIVPPPYVVIGFKRKKYSPLIKNKNLTSAVIIVLKDSNINDLRDLHNVTVVTLYPGTFADIYSRLFLMEHYKIRFHLKYVNTPENVIKHLLIGSAKAGVVSRENFIIQEDRVKKNFKIIHQSPEISSRAIVAHSTIPPEIRKAFVRSFTSLSEREDLREALTKIQLPYPVPANYKDYKKLEAYNVEKYLSW